MSRPLLALLVVLAAAIALAAGVAAQDGTPSTGAAECTVEPYDLTTVLEPSDGSPAAAASPESAPTERPSGEPADEAVVAAVTETVEQIIGCINQGYQIRVLFLFTPDYIRRFVAEFAGPLTEEEIAQLNELAASEEPQGPLPEDQQTILRSIEDVEVLEDGRVVATVIGDDRAEPGGPNPIYFIFDEVDGRYLIDGVIDPQPDGTPEA